MMDHLKKLLPTTPAPAALFDHLKDPCFKRKNSSYLNVQAKVVLPYLKPQDFGDGGAFPEIHVAQYPLGLGRRDEKYKLGTIDSHENVMFDSVVKQNENASKIVYMQHKDLIPKILTTDNKMKHEEDELKEEIIETMHKTKQVFDKIVNMRLSANNVPLQSSFIKYKPSQQSVAFDSRIIRMLDMPGDPLEPPKFKHKRVPKASASPPVPLMHSPPCPVTVKDQQDWKISPCISNWKNQKGYTIPLDKRLAADGRGLQQVQVNDNFAKLSEALYVSEQKAREAVMMRSKVQKEIFIKEKDMKEEELRALAHKARLESTGAAPPLSVPMSVDRNTMDAREREPSKETREERKERSERDKIREDRKRMRERKGRLDAKDAATGKKSKITRDRVRDIREMLALGMASTGAGRGGEVMYDQRLFNQEKGMDSGFATDDQYNVYDKGLFTAQSTLSSLYRPKKDTDTDMYGGADEQLEKVLKMERFKPDKGLSGAGERAGPREKPVEFELRQESDPFGLNQFLMDVKNGKKAMEKVGSQGSQGTLRASAGSTISSMPDEGFILSDPF